MTTTMQMLRAGITDGSIIPFIGPNALQGVSDSQSGEKMPTSSDELIFAVNNGKPMSPRLMYEFPRAAMDIELKRGRKALHNALHAIYARQSWSIAPLHQWLATITPPYLVDINRDTQLQLLYAAKPHTLIRGVARLGGSDYRFRIHHYDGNHYSDHEIAQEEVDPTLPILFKPMGSPLPTPTYIASDADYVDYLTELMGGFAIPDFVKTIRQGKQYLLLGLPLNRDTERMVLSDFIYSAATPAGWALIPQPSPKEERFCAKLNIEIITTEIAELLPETSA
ncbi:MAG: SIR2 family protein [Gammaproteobacteria bacterium]|nr:SIR2 family protein [Gammaproteobacteria bacterium]